MELGHEKVYVLARLVATTPELDSVDSVFAEGVQVGKTRKPVVDASTREVLAATRAIRAKTGKRDRCEAAAKASARALRSAVRARGDKKAATHVVRVAGGFAVVL